MSMAIRLHMPVSTVTPYAGQAMRPNACATVLVLCGAVRRSAGTTPASAN